MNNQLSYPRNKAIGFGAISGLVAGGAMIPIAILTTYFVGIPPNTIPLVIGTMIGQQLVKSGIVTQELLQSINPMIIGLGSHLITSTIIGAIFAIVTSFIPVLRISSVQKGLAFGMITASIAFGAISIPLSVFIFPEILANIMVQNMSDIQSVESAKNVMEQQGMAQISFVSSVLRHTVYGVILGGLTSVFILKTEFDRYTKGLSVFQTDK